MVYVVDDVDIFWVEDNVMFCVVVNEIVGILDDFEFEVWKE